MSSTAAAPESRYSFFHYCKGRAMMGLLLIILSEVYILYFLLLFLAGTFISVMISCNASLSSYLSLLEVTFFVHIIGAVLLTAYLRLVRKEKIRLWGFPLRLYSSGFIGVTIVAANSFCANRLGVALCSSIAVAGQVVVSTLVDHFGWFGRERLPFSPKRLPAYGVIVCGLLLMING